MSSATSARTFASTATFPDSLFAAKPSSVSTTIRPTLPNSSVPNPREVAAGDPRRIPEVTMGFCGSNGMPFLLQVIRARPSAASAIFPGLQGGPLLHVIAAKAVSFHEALTPEFNAYAHAVVANAKALAEPILAGGYKLVTGGTDNHLMLVDLTPKGLTGKAAEAALDRANITCNKNGIPFDPQKPMVTSGIRLGSPAATSRGFGTREFADVGRMVVEVLDGLAANTESGNVAVEAKVRADVAELTRRFPIY